MASQPWKQTIAIQMLPIISNQAIKFGQLRENNMSNISLEKAYTKYDGKTIARPFSKKLKLSIFRINSLSFHAVCFNGMPNCGRTNYIEINFQTIETKLRIIETSLSLISFYIFFRKQKRSASSLPGSFFGLFLKENVALVISC